MIFLGEFWYAIVVMAMPAVILGLTFPCLVRLVHAEVRAVGSEVGSAYLANTVGSVAAPLVVGFMILPHFGVRGGLLACSWGAILWGLIAVLKTDHLMSWSRRRITVGALLAAGAISFVLPRDVRLWRTSPTDRLVEYREGVNASIAVLEDRTGDVILKLDSDYRLGSARTVFAQQRQGLLPLLLHSDADSVLFIGMGTGGSAGAAAAYGNVSIDILDIVPELRELLGHFQASNERLASRLDAGGAVRFLPVDGRHFVRATDRRYDVVIGDLFLPWRAGEGGMYTREHLDAVRHVLSSDGVFCQWLPLYQLGPADLRTVVATFCDVFPHVQLWWLYFNVDQPVIGLVGTDKQLRIDMPALEVRLKNPMRMALLERAGCAEVGPLLGSWIADRSDLLAWCEGVRVETQENPKIEFSAPVNRIRDRRTLAITNAKQVLALLQPVDKSELLTGSDAAILRTARRFQESVAHFVQAEILGRSGASPAQVLHELGRSLMLTPAWDWIAWNIDQVTRRAITSGDRGTAEIGAQLLQRGETQRRLGYYYGAVLAFRAGDRARARNLVKVALEIAPEDKASAELLKEIDSGTPSQGDREQR